MKNAKIPIIEIYESPSSAIIPLRIPDEGERNSVCILCDDDFFDNGVCMDCGIPLMNDFCLPCCRDPQE